MNRGVGARILRGPVLLFAILALCALPAFGQIDRGAIVGRVMDTSGGVVPKATITVTNKATGVVMTVPVNDAGEYQVLALIPGRIPSRRAPTASRACCATTSYCT